METNNSLTSRLALNLKAATNIGVMNYVCYKLKALMLRRRRGSVVRLHSKYAAHGLWCRTGTSDQRVFNQIFIQREYRCLDDVGQAGLIIDCGANVGYSAAYMLTRFPRAQVVAVEPDPENFRTLTKNLEPYGERVTAIQSGVWSHKCGLVLVEEKLGDGLEWSRQVRECRPDEAPTVAGVDIGTILRESKFERISVLKIDVEGAERTIFDGGRADWLQYVDNLVIELHGDDCKDVFFQALSSESFRISNCDELTVCKR